MSQALHENVDVYNAEIGDNQYPPHPAQNQALRGASNFVDGSGPIFSMYLEMATEEDKKMVENWKADADGILIFTGLFSAAVASLISVSIQGIQQDPQDISNFYLANTYQATINPNISSSLPTSPPPFSPPNYAVWVNALWFLSLVISLTCALLATFLQQWARRYLKVTQSRYGLHKRARIRAFFAEGVEKCLLPWVVETLPILLHISLFLFFAGLVVFLSNVNLTIFKLVLSWVGVCVALYGCITLMPIFRHDSPYYTSLSSSAWFIVIGMAYFVSVTSGWLLCCTVLCRRGAYRLLGFAEDCYHLLLQGMQKAAEETALNSSSDIDIRLFMWTFNSLDEDHELEHFFAGLPGFRSSKVVEDPLSGLPFEEMQMLRGALTGLLDRTLSSDLLPDSVKKRRAMICAKALDRKHFSRVFDILETILSKFRYSGPLANGIAEILKGWQNNSSQGTALKAQIIIFKIIAKVQWRDDSWFMLASNELGVSETVLREYSADSLSLYILIHICQQFHYFKSHFINRTWPGPFLEDGLAFSLVLEAASEFNGEAASPELQHKFCALWNQIVAKVQNDNDQYMAWLFLRQIRKVYIALHQETDSVPTTFSASTDDLSNILNNPSSYPVCNVPGHHLDSTCHIHKDSSSINSVAVVLPDYDNHTPTPSFLPHSPGPCLTLAPALASLCVDEGIDAPPCNNNISLPVQTTTGTNNHCIPLTPTVLDVSTGT